MCLDLNWRCTSSRIRLDLCCVCRVFMKQLSGITINGRKQFGIVCCARMRGTCGMCVSDAVKVL